MRRYLTETKTYCGQLVGNCIYYFTDRVERVHKKKKNLKWFTRSIESLIGLRTKCSGLNNTDIVVRKNRQNRTAARKTTKVRTTAANFSAAYAMQDFFKRGSKLCQTWRKSHGKPKRLSHVYKTTKAKANKKKNSLNENHRVLHHCSWAYQVLRNTEQHLIRVKSSKYRIKHNKIVLKDFDLVEASIYSTI